MAEINIKISQELKKKLEKKIKQTEFGSISEYIIYILEKVTSDVSNSEAEQAYTKEEEEAVKRRLKELGYV